MKNKSVVLLLLFALLEFSSSLTFCQMISGYGLKSGFTSAWQSEYWNGDKMIGKDNRNGFIMGIYADWFNTSWYSVKSELIFSQKGTQVKIPFTNEQFPDGTGEFLESCLCLNYLSIVIIPNLYTELQNLKIYGFAGPRIDIELSKNESINGPEPARSNYSEGAEERLNNYKNFQFGFTLGVGIQVKELLPFAFGIEARYNPDISKVYDADIFYIKNNSLDFLVTLEL